MANAKIIADSISEAGIRITTLELEYPHIIHAQAKTHRVISSNDDDQYELVLKQDVDFMSDKMLSRNAQSSRAVPTSKKIELIRDLPAPNFAQNQAGMQAGGMLNNECGFNAKTEWQIAKDDAIFHAENLLNFGVHKQWSNRLIEPFSTIKVVVTATEWDNFFALRLHHDAQPEIQELAQAMKTAMNESVPKLLKADKWHLPYVDIGFGSYEETEITEENSRYITIEKLALISAARCARVSYLNHDNTNPDIEKDLELAKSLLAAGHLSPFEHQAKPISEFELFKDCITGKVLIDGITHIDRNNVFWSNNFRGWIQNRALLS